MGERTIVTRSRNYTQTPVALTSTPVTVAAYNKDRNVIIFFNTGSTEAWIGIGTAVIPIAAKNHLAFKDDLAPLNEITAQVASGSGTLTIWEA